jgi:hypothetical protein
VRKQDGALDLDLVAAADAPHDATEVSETVNGDDGGVLEGGCEEGAGQVGAVMLDKVEVGGIFGRYSFGAKDVRDLGDADWLVGRAGRAVLRPCLFRCNFDFCGSL